MSHDSLPSYLTDEIPLSAYEFDLRDEDGRDYDPLPDENARPPLDYSHLNERQREAVEYTAGQLVIIAGAGTGKTGTIVYRAARLLEQQVCPAENLMMVTFTNKAAKEIVERLHKLVGKQAKKIWAGTFHSLSLRILRKHPEEAGLQHRDFKILGEGEVNQVLKAVFRALGIHPDKPVDRDTAKMQREEIENMAEAIAKAKDSGLTPDKIAEGEDPDQIMLKIWRAYEAEMRQRNAVDFADLIQRVVLLFQAHPEIAQEWSEKFHYIMADEMQDTNPLQNAWICALADVHKNIAVVGDAAQSIYRWRGADPQFLLDFKTFWPEAHTVVIEQNYRSTQEILDVANAVLLANTHLPKKTLRSPRHGQKPRLLTFATESDEAEAIAGLIHEQLAYGMPAKEIAVLVRSRMTFLPLERALRGQSIPYGVVGGPRFYERAEIADAVGYLKLAADPNDDIGFRRAIRAPKRKVGDATIDTIVAMGREQREDLLSTSLSAVQSRRVPSSAHPGLQAFVDTINLGFRSILENQPVGNVLRAMLEDAKYFEFIDKENEPEAAAERLAHLEDLFAFANQYPTAGAFLQHAALMSAGENSTTDQEVVLATVHAAKGTEYDCVIVPAFEMGRFPNGKALEGPGGLEEERNLAHVAFTRARTNLIVTYAETRFGKPTEPSPFVAESGLQGDLLDTTVPFDLPAGKPAAHHRAA